MSRIVRGVGWTLIAAGVLILLYLAYLLFYTNFTTDQAQDGLLETWQAEYGQLPGEGELASGPDDVEEPRQVDPGDAYAAMWFERPGADEPVVRDGTLFIVEGVTLDHLKSGPGHYPDTAAPGHEGNFAISGHRTTYGAPFYHLDQLQEGDEIHVVDRQQREWVYVVRRQQIVAPTALWVIGEDPLDTGAPTMTLTTCHPRFSAAQRLIVFAELQGEAVA